jgi:hypothetical protein
MTTAQAQVDHYGMRRFVDDDAGYLQWLTMEPSGLVLNTYRAYSAAYLVLHRAKCKTIRELSGRASTFTA